MADKTEIEWTDATWNPISGCSVVSPGCKHGFAMRLAGGRLRNRLSRRSLTEPTTVGPVWNGKVRFNEQGLTAPLRWRKPRRIFVCDHGDPFHESVPVQWINRIHAVIPLAPQHIFQVLTKRSALMRDYYNDPDAEEHVKAAAASFWTGYGPTPGSLAFETSFFFPLRNLCPGVSVEDRQREWRIHHLRNTPAELRFVSFEPLLEDVSPIDLYGIGWAIVGGESGPRARRMDPAWVRPPPRPLLRRLHRLLLQAMGRFPPEERQAPARRRPPRRHSGAAGRRLLARPAPA